jgi:hypothetical protein
MLLERRFISQIIPAKGKDPGLWKKSHPELTYYAGGKCTFIELSIIGCTFQKFISAGVHCGLECKVSKNVRYDDMIM